MRKILLFIACVLGISASAQSVRMKDVFAAMPDSLMPMVTTNNRLDCIDFIENNMEAKVQNRVEEYVELKMLTEDYLLFQLSEVSHVEMKLLTVSDTLQVVCLVRTRRGAVADSHVEFYNAKDWNRLAAGIAEHLNGDRPEAEAFFTGTASLDDKERGLVENAKLMLRDLPLLEARLSPDAPTITWTMGVDELPKDEKKVAQKLVAPLTLSLLK